MHKDEARQAVKTHGTTCKAGHHKARRNQDKKRKGGEQRQQNVSHAKINTPTLRNAWVPQQIKREDEHADRK